MGSMAPAPSAVFVELQALRIIAPVLGGRVVPPLAFLARQGDE
jgi:hypothetical protein